jgi:sigma-B regulation protein RsbU (phosphoserine phosphatase)
MNPTATNRQMSDRGSARDAFWKSVTRLDWAAAVVFLLALCSEVASGLLHYGPGMGLLRLAGVVAAGYLFWRFWTKWRPQVLWSLRNRLVVAYLFIAVVPILLMLILASLLGQILYSQLAAYLLYHDVEDRVALLRESLAHIAAAEMSLPATLDERSLEIAQARQLEIAEGQQLPKLVVDFAMNPDYFRKVAGPAATSFAGLVQSGESLALTAMREVDSPRGRLYVGLSAPVDAALLDKIAPEVGPIEITLTQRVDEPTPVQIGSKYYRAIGKRLETEQRGVPEKQGMLDPVVDGFSQFEATYVGANLAVEKRHPVFAFFKTRRSQLNQRIFALVGELSGVKILELKLVAAFFLLIEIAALWIGVRLTRAIIRTISELYRATQFVQEGNLSHRVRVERQDQLGVLGESFNSMTGSISRLVNEQKQLQRLENEISIAREVQEQLFPRNFPRVQGVELDAICRAARSVSGDYYDFIQLTPTHVALAIADISGKGISAALLMASLQAALRSQLLTAGAEHMSTAELVTRLNRHVYLSTGDDRFATFFVAIYDTETRKLRYTNAGHLPGFCLADGKAIRLGVGGIVLGIVDEYEFEEGCVEVPPEAVVVGYSDGLIEPENDYGEQFGVSRLEAAAQRVRQAAPRKIAESLMLAAEEWSTSPEQADDMTVIVAKLR